MKKRTASVERKWIVDQECEQAERVERKRSEESKNRKRQSPHADFSLPSGNPPKVRAYEVAFLLIGVSDLA